MKPSGPMCGLGQLGQMHVSKVEVAASAASAPAIVVTASIEIAASSFARFT